MHAVVVRVTINDTETAVTGLQETVARVKQAPGFQAGYWTRSGNSGLSMVVLESEEAAKAGAEMVRSAAPPGVTVDDVEVREVVASA
jgi:hypothetical protein